MKFVDMHKLSSQVAFLYLLWANAALADDLIVHVQPDEAQQVIERNEMQYEEILWHSFPDHVRIARIKKELLDGPDAEFSITLFDDVPPVSVKSTGFDKRKWTGIKTQGGIPEDALRASLESQGTPESVIDQLVKQFNIVELWVHAELTDRISGEAVAYHGQYKIVPAGEVFGPVLSNVPVFSEEQVVEIISVYGDINVIDPAAAPAPYRTFTIKRLDDDPEYVMIYEWDISKNHHLMEAPRDPVAWSQSELGRKYARLREEKEDISREWPSE